jgi:Protein of unknown function (DUF3426)
VIVECPACHTRYRTDSTTIVDEDTFFECSQESCQHVFQYTPPVLRGGENEARLGNAQSAIFPPDDDAEPTQFHELPDEPPIAAAAARSFHTSDPPGPLEEPKTLPSAEDSFSDGPFFDKAFDEPEQFSPPEAPFFADEEESNDERLAFSRPAPKPQVTDIVSLRSLLTLLGSILLGYIVLASYCLWHIEDTEAALGRLPVLGALFTEERFSARHISLIEQHGNFWTTKDNRRVFAISGKAVNNALLPARSIQVEGAVYDTKGKLVGERVIFCGTETTATALESLTIREIGILQNLVPPKQFNVPAGQSVNFLIVFTSPPPTVAEFSSRVLAAQFGSS